MMHAFLFAAAINAFIHTGADGMYGFISDPDSTLRTQNGTDWTLMVAFNIDDFAAAQDALLVQFKATFNDQGNWSITWDTGGNGIILEYGTTELIPVGPITEDTWYLAAATYDEASDTLSAYVYTLPGGALVSSDTLTDTTAYTLFADSQAQTPSIGGMEVGGVIGGEQDGLSALHLYIDDYAATMAEIDAYATDPLATGDLLMSTHSGHIGFWFDDTTTCPSTCSDKTGTEFLTLAGGLTLGSGNGPDIPVRSGGGGGGGENLLLIRSILGE